MKSSALSKMEKRQLLIIAAIPVIVAVIMSFFYCSLEDKEYDSRALSQLGDFYGGILNPVIAYLGLSALIYGLKYNKNLIQQNIDAEREEKSKHHQLMAQSNAIAYLNAFEYSLRYCRKNKNDKLRDARVNIFKNYRNAASSDLHSSLALVNDEWGAVARYLFLLKSLISLYLIDSSILDAAIAQLNDEELEYVLICMAGINIEYGLEVVQEKKQLAPSICLVMKSITKLNS